MSENSVRERLGAIMRKRNITPGMMSIKTGISDRMIRNYLKGSHQPGGYSLKVIAMALNVTTDWLLGIDNEEDKYDRTGIPQSPWGEQEHTLGNPEEPAALQVPAGESE